VYHSTLGLRVIKKKKKTPHLFAVPVVDFRELRQPPRRYRFRVEVRFHLKGTGVRASAAGEQEAAPGFEPLRHFIPTI